MLGQLQAVQNNLSGLDQQMRDTASEVVQFSDTLTADIERLNAQTARFSKQLASMNNSGPEKDKPAKPADSAASSDTLLQHLPELAVPDLSLPSVSGWWHGISDWLGGLVSIERVKPKKEQQ